MVQKRYLFFQGSISIKIKSKELCCTLLTLVVALSNNFTSIHQVKVILKALEEAGIQIGEDEVFEKKFRPGINYDGKNRLGEGKRPDDVQIIQ